MLSSGCLNQEEGRKEFERILALGNPPQGTGWSLAGGGKGAAGDGQGRLLIGLQHDHCGNGSGWQSSD